MQSEVALATGPEADSMINLLGRAAYAAPISMQRYLIFVAFAHAAARTACSLANGLNSMIIRNAPMPMPQAPI